MPNAVSRGRHSTAEVVSAAFIIQIIQGNYWLFKGVKGVGRISFQTRCTGDVVALKPSSRRSPCLVSLLSPPLIPSRPLSPLTSTSALQCRTRLVPQQCLARMSYNVCLTSASCKRVFQECHTGVPYQSVRQECLPRVLRKSARQEQECQPRSAKSVLQVKSVL